MVAMVTSPASTWEVLGSTPVGCSDFFSESLQLKNKLTSEPEYTFRPYTPLAHQSLLVVSESDQLHGHGGLKCPQPAVCPWSPAQKIHGMSRLVKITLSLV